MCVHAAATLCARTRLAGDAAAYPPSRFSALGVGEKSAGERDRRTCVAKAQEVHVTVVGLVAKQATNRGHAVYAITTFT